MVWNPTLTPGANGFLVFKITMGRLHDNNSFCSVESTSAHFFNSSKPENITAKGFPSLFLASLNRSTACVSVALHAIKNPPNPLIVTISPRNILSATNVVILSIPSILFPW
ncbi:hypothetical protein ES705_41576 [subsurface metagenome]